MLRDENDAALAGPEEKPESGKPAMHARWIFSGVFGLIFLWRTLLPGSVERIDEVALGILLLAALPWIGSFLRSFKAFGIEAELTELKRQANEATAAARDASQQLELAQPISRPAPERSTPSETLGDVTERNDFDAVEKIAQEYVSTRASMKPGEKRTSEMTRIFRRIMAEAEQMGPDHPRALDGLESENSGEQLASIAYAYTFPETVTPEVLIATIGRSREPFVQYWGLMALRKYSKQVGIGKFSASGVAAFMSLKAAFRPGTDRAWVYRQIAEELGIQE